MIEKILKLIIGHTHKFEIYSEIRIFEKEEDRLPSGHKIVQICKECGKIKQTRIY